MKKRLLLIALLIVTITITGNVDALGSEFSGSIVMGSQMNIPTGAPAKDPYVTHEFKLVVGTMEYEAYCIRPGKGASGTNPVTCRELDPTLYGMTYAAAQDRAWNESADKRVKDIVYRTLGIMDRASAVYLDTGGNEEGGLHTSTYDFFVVQWHHHLVWRNGDIANDVDPSWARHVATSSFFTEAYTQAQNYYKYWVGKPGHQIIRTSTNGIDYGINQASGDKGSYFGYIKTESRNKTRYKFYALTNPSMSGSPTMDQVEIQVTAPGRVVQEWNGFYAVVEVPAGTTESECNATVTISGHMLSRDGDLAQENKKVYLCSMLTGGTNKQQYVAFAPGKPGDRFNLSTNCNCVEQSSSDDYDSNNEKTCDDTVTSDYYKEAEVHNCCLDGRTSKLEEYSLDELFCSGENTKIHAEYFTNKCFNKGYHDDVIWEELTSSITVSGSTETVQKYCQARCTERIEITVPEAILSATGKFFKMSNQWSRHGTTTGPIIDGTKRCTIKIDYRKARKTYEDYIDGEVSAWNDYQTNQAGCDLTIYSTSDEEVSTDAVDFTVEKKWKTCTTKEEKTAAPGGKVTVYSYDEDGECSGGTEETCSSTSTTNCKYTSYKNEEHSDTKKSTRAKCTQKYKVYKLTGSAAGVSCSGGSCKVSYYHVKVNDEFPYSKKKWTGLTMKPSVTGAAGSISYDEYTKTSSSGDCDSAISDAKTRYESEGYYYKSGSTAYNKYKSEHAGYAVKDTPGTHKTYCDKATSAAGTFSTNKALASDIENIVYGCENFLAGTKAGESAGHNDRFYALKPTATFHYLQIILEGNDKKTPMKGQVNYEPNCEITFHEGDDTDANRATIDSSLFGEGSEDMVDLGVLARQTDNSIPTDDRTQKTWTKHVRTNAYYEAYCTFDPPADHDGEVTIYPGPTFEPLASLSGSISLGKTGHKYQYALYLTAFSGQFQTWWELTGLGGASKTISKFTKAFNEHGTCAELGYNYSVGDAEGARTSTTAPFTCSLDLIDGGMRIGTCPPDVDETTDLKGCKPNVNSVYEFRVVDPANMFPGDWTNKADNWRRSKNGPWRPVKANIESNANKAYSPDYLTYSFTIDSKAIKAIKDYNAKEVSDGRTYADAKLECKSCNTSAESYGCGTIQSSSVCNISGTFLYSCGHCYSPFLENLANKKVGTTTLTREVWHNPYVSSITVLRNATSGNRVVHWSR